MYNSTETNNIVKIFITKSNTIIATFSIEDFDCIEHADHEIENHAEPLSDGPVMNQFNVCIGDISNSHFVGSKSYLKSMDLDELLDEYHDDLG